MKRPERRVNDYLRHICDAASRIESYLAGLDTAFDTDLRTQDAIIRRLKSIGEAARHVQRVAPELAAANPEIPWALAWRMRNVLSHGYADVDLGAVWNTALVDVPAFADQVAALLADD